MTRLEIAIIVAVIVVLGACVWLLSGMAHAHEWYTGLRNSNGVGCCNQKDCRPAQECTTTSRGNGIVIDGACVGFSGSVVLTMPSPDGETHACWTSTTPPRILCVIRGGSA